MQISDVALDLTEAEAMANYGNWAQRWGCNGATVVDCPQALKLPLTHSFPLRKVWRSGQRDLCHEILEIGEGLLSDRFREDNARYQPSERRPHMPEARSMGLDRYVFSYLGVHDPYYSRTGESVPVATFGVFLRNASEVFPRCNATRRDLASPLSTYRTNPRIEFLTANDARRLCCCQVATDCENNKHEANFWHYWGAAEFWQNAYADEHWKWKFEFHFLERIPIADFEGILWPALSAADAGGGTCSSSLQARAEIIQSRYPRCKIVYYDWDDRRPLMCFVDASTAVAKFLLKHGYYPSFAGDALAEFGYVT